MIDKKGKNILKNDPLNHFIYHLFIVNVSNSIRVSRDFDDDKFIECAINCKANYIVSGDNNLLVLKECKGIKIVIVDEFLKIVTLL